MLTSELPSRRLSFGWLGSSPRASSKAAFPRLDEATLAILT